MMEISREELQYHRANLTSFSGDKPLSDALQLMNDEGLTSIPVVDNAFNVVGNISTADVKLLTNSASLPLLKASCIHFVSVILTERGVNDGKDSFPGNSAIFSIHFVHLLIFPVFHVSPYSTLGHTIAKLLATRSHRMWIVESSSPSPSPGTTPLATPSVSSANLHSPMATLHSPIPPTPTSPSLGAFPAVSAASMPGARISGRLTGVISLTDILNLFGRQSGLNPLSPSDQRDRRRRSSSSSMRPSIDSVRGSSIDIRR